MPELPDVEVFRQYFDATSLHQEIEAIEVRADRVLKDNSESGITDALVDHQFEETHRHGKYLFTRLDNDRWLAIHFGMTGQPRYYKRSAKEPDYAYFLIHFTNEYTLAFRIPRKLGGFEVVASVESFVDNKDLGPDVLREDFDVKHFLDLLDGRREMIKSTLMNQQIMAGIGNVYSDEILYQARIYPRRSVDDLSEADQRTLFHTMKKVLLTAITQDADPQQFSEEWLIPHRKPDGRCPKCDGMVEKIDVAGRSGYYCPSCQGDE